MTAPEVTVLVVALVVFSALAVSTVRDQRRIKALVAEQERRHPRPVSRVNVQQALASLPDAALLRVAAACLAKRCDPELGRALRDRADRHDATDDQPPVPAAHDCSQPRRTPLSYHL